MNKPQIDEVDYLLDKVIKGCEMKFFHTFKYRCVYDINVTNITNNEKVILIISHEYIEFKTKHYGVNKKVNKKKNSKFKIDEMFKITIKIYSN